MVYIPGIMVNKIYESGSLRNTDDGFEFQFVNKITPLKISGMRDFALEVDGVRYPTEAIRLELDGRTVDINGGVGGAHEFARNNALVIRVAGHTLSPGRHVIRLGLITNEYGGATLKVGDELAGENLAGEKMRVRFPILSFVANLIERIGDEKKRDEPLHIDGRFPVLNAVLEVIDNATRGRRVRDAAPGRLSFTGELGGAPLDPDFARLEAVLRREEPDRVPLFEAEIALPVQEWFLGREINTVADEIEFYVRAGYDYVPVVPPFFAPRRMSAARGDNDTEERQWITESDGVIKTVADVESFPWSRAEDVDFSAFQEVAALLPDKMKILGMLSPAAIFGNVSQAMGLQNFSYALYDDIRVVEALFEIIGDTYLKIAKRIVTMPRLGAVFMSDDLAYAGGLLVSPKIYKKYVFPRYKQIGEILAGAGLPFIFHSDGTLWQVFDDLADCGVNAIHPIEPLAMDILEVKKRYGDTFCIFGNIDLEYTLTRGTPEEVETMVKEKIRTLAPGGGWGLAASNSIPDYVKPENYRAMIETGKKYGRYPICL